MDRFNNRLKQALTLRNMSQRALSRACGVSAGNISSYLHGRFEPKADTLEKMARVLDVSPAWLLGYDVPPDRDLPVSVDLSASERILIDSWRRLDDKNKGVLLAYVEFLKNGGAS